MDASRTIIITHHLHQTLLRRQYVVRRLLLCFIAAILIDLKNVVSLNSNSCEIIFKSITYYILNMLLILKLGQDEPSPIVFHLSLLYQ
ncbi:hypothetical protein QTP88_008882 [Uroleucon formosanum]